jgi:hypothetical protein
MFLAFPILPIPYPFLSGLRLEFFHIFGANFHVLPEGYQFDLARREPITPDVKKLVKQG